MPPQSNVQPPFSLNGLSLCLAKPLIRTSFSWYWSQYLTISATHSDTGKRCMAASERSCSTSLRCACRPSWNLFIMRIAHSTRAMLKVDCITIWYKVYAEVKCLFFFVCFCFYLILFLLCFFFFFFFSYCIILFLFVVFLFLCFFVFVFVFVKYSYKFWKRMKCNFTSLFLRRSECKQKNLHQKFHCIHCSCFLLRAKQFLDSIF